MLFNEVKSYYKEKHTWQQNILLVGNEIDPNKI